jgi:HD-GYP domain-containing protein (c-di-GMP phosphodiesterase class II)
VLRVSITDARPGMRLAMPVYHPLPPHQQLLKIGYEIEQPALDRMKELGVRRLWVHYPQLDFLLKRIDPQIMAAQGEVVTHIATTFQSLQSTANVKIPYDTYCATITDMVEKLVANPQAALFLGDLFDSGGDDLMRHCSSTAYMSLLMGLKLQGYLIQQRRHISPWRAQQITHLGTGAMLHDVGVTRLPPEVCEEHARNGEETPDWQEHPRLGYELVHGQVEPTAAAVVLQHHQRWDGSGYAGSGVPVLGGYRIHVFARIAAVADAVDRLQHPRNPPHARARPLVAALKTMVQDSARFDPNVLLALLMVVPPYPPGAMLRLSDGRTAVAVDHNASQPCRPTVEILRGADGPAGVYGAVADTELLNLAEQDPKLIVTHCDGQEVKDFNFQISQAWRNGMYSIGRM